MRTETANCGTVWATSETWTYTSTYDGPEGYFNSYSSPKASVGAAVDDLMADLARGADAYEVCETKHRNREILLYTLGGAAIALLAVGTYRLLADRRRALASAP